jgi:multiple sugar transport system substrate-binding protein
MDDNKKKPDENQPIDSTQETQNQPPPQPVTPNSPEEPKPIFETVPEEQNQASQPQSATESLTPEEISSDVTTPTPEEISPSQPLPSDSPPMVYEESKNKYFVIVVAVIIFVILMIIFIKVLFGGKKIPKNISLTYWGLWEDKEVFQPLIDQYQKSNPQIKIDYQKMDQQDYRDKLLARSKNGQGPDIFRFHNTWLPEIRELAAPLPSTVMSSTEFEKTFYKIHQKDLKVDTYYYGLPLEIDGLVLIYNENLLKKAGIQTAPASWDEVTDIVSKLTVKDKSGNLITSGIALGTTSNVEHFSNIFGLMLLQNGGSLKKLDQPEAAGALEIYRKFAEAPQAFWDDNMPNSTTAFIQEKVAMILAPSWVILNIKAANPDISLKVVPVPSVPGATPVSIADYWVEGVSRYSKYQLEAWKFLHYLVQKDNLTKLYEIQARLRPFGEPYSRIDLAPILAQNEYLGAVIKQADSYMSIPIIKRTYDAGLNDELIQYIENAVNATIQGVSYQEALKTASEGVNQVFTKYKIE